MNLPNIIYKLADGRMWDVPNARFLSAYEKSRLEAQPAESLSDYDLTELVSASGESDEAYLLRTLEFYHFPTGALTLNTIPALKYGLKQLDEEYLTPRTLGGLAENDPEALARWNEHERLAEPLREKLRQLEGQSE